MLLHVLSYSSLQIEPSGKLQPLVLWGLLLQAVGLVCFSEQARHCHFISGKTGLKELLFFCVIRHVDSPVCVIRFQERSALLRQYIDAISIVVE
jgi:hypothetical protein